MAERTGPVAVDAALHDLAEVLARYLEAKGWTAAEGDVPVFTASLIIAAPELLASCKELREALAGAMRVLEAAVEDKADIIDDFVDEMNRAGIADGVGVRADHAIKKAQGLPA